MRIEHLSADNQRTQGAERRAWYGRYSAKHLQAVERSARDALRARTPGAPNNSVILGAGACTELPLDRMARQLDAITLVDLDAPGMGRARNELPEAQRANVRLLAADLTGGVSALLQEETHLQPWRDLRDLSDRALLDAMAGCLERVEVPSPPTIPGLEPHSFGLVVSSLTLTQLYSLPLLDALDILLAYTPNQAERRDEYPRYAEAADNFRRRIVLAHLDLMAELLAPGGVALLTTDRLGYLLPPKSGPHADEGREEFVTLPAAAMRWPADLEERFTVAATTGPWAWMVAMPDAEQPGRAYGVISALLRPRG